MPEVSDAVERLLAYEGIRRLVARYALALDSRDLDTLVSLFVPDVRVGGGVTGRDALRAGFDRSLRGVGVTILNVGTHVIDLGEPDGDGAATEATGSVYCKGEIQHDERWIHQAILYRDRYRRVDGDWLFVRRDHQLWYGAEVGVNPLGLPPADWPTHHDGRGTVPECWDTWRAFWASSDKG